MLAKLVDRWRGVIVTAAVGNPDDENQFAVLRDLAKGYIGNVHAEFEVDREFFAALEAQAKAEAEQGQTENVLIEMQDGRNLPSFLNIPILVEGGAPKRELSPAEFRNGGPVDSRIGEE